MSAVVWEDPPAIISHGGRQRVWEPLLVPLMAEPKRWARIETTKTSKQATDLAGNLRRVLKIPPGEWEFTARKQSDGTGAVYARYLGPDGEGSRTP